MRHKDFFNINAKLMILAAPIQGYTERFYRHAHASVIGGIDEYYTPFIRLEKKQLRERDLKDLQPDDTVPTVPQILAKNTEETRTLAQTVAQLGYSRLDINAGCPFPKVTAAGYGAALLKNLDALRDVLDTAISFHKLSVSIKLRLPEPSTNDAIQHLAEILNDYPLTHIVLHPRSASQQYNGIPDHNAFITFKNASKHTLVFNGDIQTLQDADSVRNNLQTQHLMLGRGLLANPLLPLSLKGQHISTEQQSQKLLAFHDEILAQLGGDRHALPKLKTLWDYLLPNIQTRLKKHIVKATTLEEYIKHVQCALAN